MAWFGPRGDCGCCTSFIPCECLDGQGCVPASPGYYRNMAIEISEIPDEIFRTATTTYNACTGRACRPADVLVNYNEWRYMDMSQFNGTYPILFYEYDADADEYFESNPANGCGFWGAGTVTKTVRFQRINQQEFAFSGSNPPCHDFYESGVLTFDLTFDVFDNAIILPSFPIPAPAGWNDFRLGNRTSPLIPQTTDPLITRHQNLLRSDCGGGAAINTTDTVRTNDPLHSRTIAPSYFGGLVPDILLARRVTPPGSVGGLPSANFPAGVRILDSRSCTINNVESFIEYEQFIATTSSAADCGVSSEGIFSGWKVRRKLIYDGV